MGYVTIEELRDLLTPAAPKVDATALRALASRLEERMAAPSLEGYDLADGLRAAADLLEGKEGPEVHAGLTEETEGWPLRDIPRVALSRLLGKRQR